MTIRSRLFATVAFPMLSMSIAIQPALADSLMKPFEVAQEDGAAQADGGGEQVPEELLRKKRKQRAEQPAEEAQPAGEAQPQEEKPRRKKRQEAEQQQEQQQEAQPAEEEQPSRAERKKRQQAEQQQQQQEKAQPSADDEAAKAAEEKAKARAERKKRQQAEQQQQKEAQPSADDEAAKAAEEKAKARAERKKRQQAEQQQTEEAQPSNDDKASQKAAEERKRIRAEQKARADAEQNDQQPVTEDGLRPATDEDEANQEGRKPRDRREPIPKVVDTRTKEEKQKIARDPSKTDETVVLPVDNGAAVLDSDKEADNSGDTGAREKRRKQRERVRTEENQNVEVPKSDEEAQRGRKDRRPSRDELEAATREKGRRVDDVPAFNIPDLIDAFTGNDRRRPRIDDTRDDRTVLDFGDKIIVRGDDRPRLRRNATETYYEELSGGRSRETIERAGGIRVVTIYNRYGDIIQRSRIDASGREYLMIYAPEADSGPRPPAFDAGEDLPPMRLRVPVEDYIIDTSSEPDRDYYEFLAEPPVEQVERTYTIDEVRSSARIRDKVRRIDLDTITFATNSAEVPLSQAKTLRKVADAMLEVIEKDPGETFFIEGHTDAVGGDEPNLVLSDERAESVASLLTEVYDIPAENLVPQGYGERFLKVRTLEAEQQNRRVTIRRVTPLVRPVAQN
ncbi:MAG TPA: OmpA family protein [Pararhizobium sp.]|uniref:OmpA family protein n=1 Tax=Pararhizobium sp. TaxID=1977563 RepID=UPI002B6A7F16|nr:OmpA family protein [Pararhizobium sp.]HTO32497.1 OmpA family protein [Pararhizobium sp.]